ncbi:MAG TPA: PTS lactose/cellobiose transporter subunit IIA, partial [Candidatus Jeotgalibaca merdavium]
AHTSLIQKEAAGEKVELSLIIMHAEDQLMSTETTKLLIEEMIEMFKQLNNK